MSAKDEDEEDEIKLLFLICIMKTFRMEITEALLSLPGGGREIIFISNFNKI
jgi:hypothetical protein